ncbi:hypothetical protein HR12_02880 [Microbacterium sp. SUBG005]|nr:hypothetical protein HR12_02880 [Microbacterium sp. SUBG005]
MRVCGTCQERLKSASFARRECSWLVTESTLQWCRLNWLAKRRISSVSPETESTMASAFFSHVVSDREIRIVDMVTEFPDI